MCSVIFDAVLSVCVPGQFVVLARMWNYIALFPEHYLVIHFGKRRLQKFDGSVLKEFLVI